MWTVSKKTQQPLQPKCNSDAVEEKCSNPNSQKAELQENISNSKRKRDKAKAKAKAGSDTNTQNSAKTISNVGNNSNEQPNSGGKGFEWKKIEIPKHMTTPDNEIGGLVEFEEIDGGYFDLAAFQPTDAAQSEELPRKKKKKRKVETEDFEVDDLNDVDWDDFIFLDDYSEENAKSGKLKSIGQLARESADPNQTESADDSEDKVIENELQSDNEDTTHPHDTDEDTRKKSKEKPSTLNSFSENSRWTWKNLGLCDALLDGIQSCGLEKPTDIQKRAIPPAIKGRDILGAAETGSGKTLAFGLPVLQYVITNRPEEVSDRDLMALVLLPTRELALQVKENFSRVDRGSPVRVVALVGGMSLQKQERQLKQNPEIIVATPGRLWEIVEQTDLLAGKLAKLKFLVLDEADRMVERGHFKELSEILRIINSGNETKRQTMVFSATLAKDLSFQKRKASTPKGTNPENPMQEMINLLRFRDPKPQLVDVTPANSVPDKIFESRIDCVKTEKEIYLYFFLTRFIGKSLVFVNSISSIRRLVPILSNLNVQVFPLHAQMQQRQRLKNLDRFKTSPNGVLIASDVAARGLDIPAVDHVIHYQVPRGGELYVHRSGRTARAHLEGVVVIFVCPEERKNYLRLCKTLKKNEIPAFPIEYSIVAKFKPLVTLSREIDSIEHRMNKETHDQDWMAKAADEMGIELDPDFMKAKPKKSDSIIIDEYDDEYADKTSRDKHKVKQLKEELKYRLSKPILPPGAMKSYLTNGAVTGIAHKILNKSQYNQRMPFVLNETALDLARKL